MPEPCNSEPLREISPKLLISIDLLIWNLCGTDVQKRKDRQFRDRLNDFAVILLT